MADTGSYEMPTTADGTQDTDALNRPDAPEFEDAVVTQAEMELANHRGPVSRRALRVLARGGIARALQLADDNTKQITLNDVVQVVLSDYAASVHGFREADAFKPQLGESLDDFLPSTEVEDPTDPVNQGVRPDSGQSWLSTLLIAVAWLPLLTLRIVLVAVQVTIQVIRHPFKDQVIRGWRVETPNR